MKTLSEAKLLYPAYIQARLQQKEQFIVAFRGCVAKRCKTQQQIYEKFSRIKITHMPAISTRTFWSSWAYCRGTHSEGAATLA